MMAITARQRAAPNFEIIPEDSRNKQNVRGQFFSKTIRKRFFLTLLRARQCQSALFSLCSTPGLSETTGFHMFFTRFISISVKNDAKTRRFHFAPRPACPKPHVFSHCLSRFISTSFRKRCENTSFSLCPAPGLSEATRFQAFFSRVNNICLGNERNTPPRPAPPRPACSLHFMNISTRKRRESTSF